MSFPLRAYFLWGSGLTTTAGLSAGRPFVTSALSVGVSGIGRAWPRAGVTSSMRDLIPTSTAFMV